MNWNLNTRPLFFSNFHITREDRFKILMCEKLIASESNILTILQIEIFFVFVELLLLDKP